MKWGTSWQWRKIRNLVAAHQLHWNYSLRFSFDWVNSMLLMLISTWFNGGSLREAGLWEPTRIPRETRVYPIFMPKGSLKDPWKIPGRIAKEGEKGPTIKEKTTVNGPLTNNETSVIWHDNKEPLFGLTQAAGSAQPTSWQGAFFIFLFLPLFSPFRRGFTGFLQGFAQFSGLTGLTLPFVRVRGQLHSIYYWFFCPHELGISNSWL